MNAITGTVNWGILGCGDVCEVKSGPAFNKVKDSRLVAVMRRDREKAADFAKRHGVPKSYHVAEDLIRDPGINAIYIATPPAYHEEYLAAALQAEKPVYVEKPVAMDTEGCNRMKVQAASSGGLVSVAHYRRGVPLFVKLKSLIHSGAIGNVKLIRIVTLQPKASKIITQTEDNWRVNPKVSGGGLFHDLSPHQLDMMYWIFGEPVSLRGRSLNQSNLYDAPDITTLEAEFKGGIMMQGVWAFSVGESAAQESCEIIGDAGMIRFSFFRVSTIELTTDRGTESMTFQYPVNIQEPMIAAVCAYFRGEGPNPCSLDEAAIVMRMIDATVHQ